ncbi:MAG: hypothetical protein KTR16_08940 [Acidiferrobacterales bacterium]|nr:hypothetical protein [Acidiferrobacterales bacterium]
MMRSRYFSATIAFILWGGWAFVINSTASLTAGLQAAIAQGMASFIITLLMVHKVEFWVSKFNRPVLEVIAPAVITVAFTGTGLFLLHSLVATPNIIKTIAPALTVAFLFCLFTSVQLNKSKKESSNEAT